MKEFKLEINRMEGVQVLRLGREMAITGLEGNENYNLRVGNKEGLRKTQDGKNCLELPGFR